MRIISLSGSSIKKYNAVQGIFLACTLVTCCHCSQTLSHLQMLLVNCSDLVTVQKLAKSK